MCNGMTVQLQLLLLWINQVQCWYSRETALAHDCCDFGRSKYKEPDTRMPVLALKLLMLEKVDRLLIYRPTIDIFGLHNQIRWPVEAHQLL